MKIKGIVKTPAKGAKTGMSKSFRSTSKKFLVRYPNGGSGSKTYYVSPSIRDSINFYKNAI
jgi:hypothetical protein